LKLTIRIAHRDSTGPASMRRRISAPRPPWDPRKRSFPRGQRVEKVSRCGPEDGIERLASTGLRRVEWGSMVGERGFLRGPSVKKGPVGTPLIQSAEVLYAPREAPACFRGERPLVTLGPLGRTVWMGLGTQESLGEWARSLMERALSCRGNSKDL